MAEVPVEDLRQTAESDGPTMVTEEHGVTVVETHELLEASAVSNPSVHPLFRLQAQAMLDRQDPEACRVEDHGSWDGRWELPSVCDWKARSVLGLKWPSGRSEFEIQAVQAARKEYRWKSMTTEQKEAFKEAAKEGWAVWLRNEAVEPLSEEESLKIRQALKVKNESYKILAPRFVYTDKNDGLRTSARDLPVKASARLVVPGFRDITAYEIRKDAPTASRISQHLVMIYASSKFAAGWRLWSADVKSAFLKGDPYMSGEREIYVQDVRRSDPSEPGVPLENGRLAKVRKGVFGLADAPRMWWLRLDRALSERGWQRGMMDGACWYLRGAQRELRGIIISHVDDLLVTGDEEVKKHLYDLGKELGFGSLEHGLDGFQYCGKLIKQQADGRIEVSMKEYHANLKQVVIPLERRRNPGAALTPSEHRQLRALTGSMQWLVAQLRFDLQFQLSSLQGEPPTVGALMRANQLLKRFKQHGDFMLTFKPMDLDHAGLMVVSDASLGNVKKDGSVGEAPLERVFSQAAYFVLIGDKDLMEGREGTFAVLDARSHRLNRVCRSTFAAELLGVEEAMDVGQFCRGFLGEARGRPISTRQVDLLAESIELQIIVDAKDVFDKGNSDTAASYGSQKSLAFSIAWLRSMLRKEKTSIKWTSTENMFVDAGTKEMDEQHLHRILHSCRWCAKYSPDFIKQTAKKTKTVPRTDLAVVGESLNSSDLVFHHLLRLGEQPGWHKESDDLAVHVAKHARSFRIPEPRFDSDRFPLRSSYGRFDRSSGQVEWRRLEEKVAMKDLGLKQGLIGDTANVLVSFFHSHDGPSSANKKDISPED